MFKKFYKEVHEYKVKKNESCKNYDNAIEGVLILYDKGKTILTNKFKKIIEKW